MIRRRCRRLQPALLQRRVHDRLDHAVAEVALQLTQPHEIRQPPARPHAAVPADHGRGRHHQAAEHRQLARRRRPGGLRRHRPAAVNPQASGPHHHRPRGRGPRGLACINDGRQIRKHRGSRDGWIRHPNAYQEPPQQITHPRPAATQNPRSRPHEPGTPPVHARARAGRGPGGGHGGGRPVVAAAGVGTPRHRRPVWLAASVVLAAGWWRSRRRRLNRHRVTRRCRRWVPAR